MILKAKCQVVYNLVRKQQELMFLVSHVIFVTPLKKLYKETTFTKAINSLFLALESINRALLLLQLLALILLQHSRFNTQNLSNLSTMS